MFDGLAYFDSENIILASMFMNYMLDNIINLYWNQLLKLISIIYIIWPSLYAGLPESTLRFAHRDLGS